MSTRAVGPFDQHGVRLADAMAPGPSRAMFVPVPTVTVDLLRLLPVIFEKGRFDSACVNKFDELPHVGVGGKHDLHLIAF